MSLDTLSWVGLGLGVFSLVACLVVGRTIKLREQRETHGLLPRGSDIWFPEHVHIDNTGDFPVITAEGHWWPKKLRVKDVPPNMPIWVDVNGDFEQMVIREVRIPDMHWMAQDALSLKSRYWAEGKEKVD